MNSIFQWDEENLRHALYDHPERNNTVERIESVILHKDTIRTDPYIEKDEVRVSAIGPEGTNGKLYCVTYTMRDGLIRPFSCRRVSKPAKIKEYHEKLKANRT